MGIDKFKSASKFFPWRRCGDVTSNVAEQLNNVQRADRELPTIEILDAVLNRCMVQCCSRLREGHSRGVRSAENLAQYTPHALKLAMALITNARANVPQLASLSELKKELYSPMAWFASSTLRSDNVRAALFRTATFRVAMRFMPFLRYDSLFGSTCPTFT
jgi:hypothetical protein